VEQHVGRIPKCDEKIHPAVVIEVDPGNLAGLSLYIDAHLFGDIDEVLAIAIVAVKFIGSSGSSAEPDVQVDMTVGIEIAPGCGPSVGQVGHAEIGAYLGEFAVIIAIQTIRQIRFESDEQVKITIVVEVGPAIGLTTGSGEKFRLNGYEVSW
jgi:hypothetical protein